MERSVPARMVIVAALLVGAMDIGTARAQRADQPAAPPANARFGDPTDTARNLENFVYGVIKAVNAAELVCDKTEFGDGQPFKLDKKTKYLRDGEPSTADGLKAGDKIWVKIRKDKKTGELTALTVVTGAVPTGTKIK